jgi:hypothetical protein
MLTLLSSGQGQSGTYVELMLQAYKLRVYAEAGVFEAEECLKASLNTLDNYQVDPDAQLVRNYATRVRADGGTVEGFKSTITSIKTLNNSDLHDKASLSLFPSGVKAGKAYSILPTNGNGDFDVTRNTTATRVNSSGLIENVAANVPRLNYDTIGGLPSILLETQTNNLNTFSEDFTDVSYNKTRSSISSNAALSPDGNNTADKLIATTDNNNHQVSKTYSNTVGSVVSFSVFVKKSELIYCQLRITDNATNNGGTQNSFNALYDLQNGVITSTIESGVVNSLNPFTSIKSFGNDWYRCEIGLKKSSNQVRTDVSLFTSNSSTAATNPVYVGNNVDGFFIFGQQIEERAATSYIPTTSAAVTRNQDLISKTGISDLINSQQTTFFVDAKIFADDGINRAISLSDGTFNNRVSITYHLTSQRIQIISVKGGGILFNFEILTAVKTNFNKIAVVFNNTSAKFFMNGILIQQSTITSSYAAATLTKLSFDAGPTNNLNFDGQVKSLQIYKTALTDAECIALTS